MKVFLNRIDLKGMKFSDDGNSSWVQIFRLGTWEHPKYGKLTFTENTFDGFIKSFNNNVRNVDIALDTEHEPEKGACGWFKKLKSENGGLWGLIEWTPRGRQLVSDEVFKYLSGDFDYIWKDEESGKKYNNVLFGAALTNRPFIKGMSPINLSEFAKELEVNKSTLNSLQLAEDIIKLKEGVKVKTDAEILVAKEEDLTPEEKARKAEINKTQLAERAKKVGLSEDEEEEVIIEKEKEKEKELVDEEEELKMRALALGLPETATIEEIEKKEEEDAKKLAEANISPENEQRVKITSALGLAKDATLDEIYAAVNSFIQAAKPTEGSANTMLSRARAVGLSKNASEKMIILKEKELANAKSLKEADIILSMGLPALEVKLAEMKRNGTDALTVRLLADTIATKKTLHIERAKNAKERVELTLKEHFRAGKLTAKEFETFKTILFSEIEQGETSVKLSEKDTEGKKVETSKTLSVIIDDMLEERPAIIELQEIAKIELEELPEEEDEKKELEDEEAQDIGSRVANKVTGSSKSSKNLSARAVRLGLPADATKEEIEEKEMKK